MIKVTKLIFPDSDCQIETFFNDTDCVSLSITHPANPVQNSGIVVLSKDDLMGLVEHLNSLISVI